VLEAHEAIAHEDREFVAAIKDGREPNTSVAQVLRAMETLGRLEKCLKADRRA